MDLRADLVTPIVLWEPEPDITVYELAVALGVMFAVAGKLRGQRLADHVDALPDEVRRHFTVKPPSRPTP